MKDFSHSLSPEPAKVSMTFPIMQQCVVLILAGMILDGGQVFQVFGYAALAY